MPKPRAKFEYDYESIVKLSDWPYNRLVRDVTDGKLNPDDLASVLCWLAQNGKSWVRARLAAAILPDLFGCNRGSELDAQMAPELLQIVFQQARTERKSVAKKCGRRALQRNLTIGLNSVPAR